MVFVDGAEGADVGRVDGRDDGEVVLVFLEVGVGGGEGVVEGVGEGRVEGPEGELIDVVGEVEYYTRSISSCMV